MPVLLRSRLLLVDCDGCWLLGGWLLQPLQSMHEIHPHLHDYFENTKIRYGSRCLDLDYRISHPYLRETCTQTTTHT